MPKNNCQYDQQIIDIIITQEQKTVRLMYNALSRKLRRKLESALDEEQTRQDYLDKLSPDLQRKPRLFLRELEYSIATYDILPPTQQALDTSLLRATFHHFRLLAAAGKPCSTTTYAHAVQNSFDTFGGIDKFFDMYHKTCDYEELSSQNPLRVIIGVAERQARSLYKLPLAAWAF